jgi:hypothetical protein
MKDILLHATAAFALTLLALTGPLGLVFAITFMWLLRELAQRDKSNLLNALASMPQWSFTKHMEWLVTALASGLAILIFNSFEVPLNAILHPL